MTAVPSGAVLVGEVANTANFGVIWSGQTGFSIRIRLKATSNITVAGIAVRWHTGTNGSDGGVVGIAVAGSGAPTWMQVGGQDVKTAFTNASLTRGAYNWFQFPQPLVLAANTFFDVTFVNGAGDLVAAPMNYNVQTNVIDAGGAYYGFSGSVPNQAQPSYGADIQFYSLDQINFNGVGYVSIGPTTGSWNMPAAAAGKSTVTFGLTPVKRAGDIVVRSSTPQPQDIILDTPEGPYSLVSTPAGASTVTMGMGNKQRTLTTSAGVASEIQSLGIGVKPVNQPAAGVGGWPLNRLTVIKEADRFVIYASKPPYNTTDVLMGTRDGPGAQQGFAMVSNGQAGLSVSLGHTERMTARGDGVAASPSNRLGARYAIAITSAGRATMVDYLGSPIRIASTAAGRAGCTNNYIGTPVRITSTAAGIGHLTAYLGSPLYVSSTSAGVGHMTGYISTPVRIAFTAAGRAACTTNYLSTPFHVTSLSAGRATANTYLGAPFHITSAAAGRATVNTYLSSRIYFAGTSPGRGGASIYLAAPFHITATAHGVGDWQNILGGPVRPITVMRGVAHWSLGPAFIFALPMAGVGHVNDIRTTGTLRIATTSNGVGNMHDNVRLLLTTSNGSAAGTQMDKPPFALVCYAGCRAYYGGGQRIDSGVLSYDYTPVPFGVFMYLSAPIRFGNHDYNIEGRGNASMAGRSSFTFPYEMVAISNAGCRAFTSYPSDQDPALGFPGQGGRPGGVRARQFSPDYMFARTNSFNGSSFSAGAHVSAYLSSKVYFAGAAVGRATVTFLRFGEFEADGVGGFLPTLGAPQRIAGASHGIGGWPTNYLPDRRDMAISPAGVGHMLGYQHGPVHFEAGLIQSNGVGNFFIDPGLVRTTIHGVGHMNDIERPSGVYMRWGSGQFYYSQHFPLIAPLLIPNGSNGMSNVRVEIDHVPIMHHHSNGVGHASLVPDGIERRASMRADAGSYKHYLPTGRFTDLFGRFDYGVVITAKPVEVVWSPAGIGHMSGTMRMFYILRWMTRGQRFTGDGRDTGGTEGGVGTFAFAGPRAVSLLAQGRANDRIKADVTARFAAVSPIHGIATMIAFTGVPDDRIGNLLRFFFEPMPTGEGQFWPRRTPQPV